MKIGRNDPCPCGSGKKFKKCCIDKPEYKAPSVVEFRPREGSKEQSVWPRLATNAEKPLKHRLTGGSNEESVMQRLADIMKHGVEQLEADKDDEAARIWLEGWSLLLEYARTEQLPSLEAVDDRGGSTLPDFVSNWIQDLEACLGNLATADENWAQARLKMIQELLQQFPDTHSHIIFNMREAAAETQFLLGHPDEGDALFTALVDTYPDNAWAYIGWGDMYSPVFYRDRWQKNPDRARELYERGLAGPVLADRDMIEERIQLLDDPSLDE
jgi:hypothetical protein